MNNDQFAFNSDLIPDQQQNISFIRYAKKKSNLPNNNMGEKTMVDILQSMHDNHLSQELKTISGLHITAKTCRTTGITIKRRKLGLTALKKAMFSLMPVRKLPALLQ